MSTKTSKSWGTWGGFSGEFGGVAGTLGIMIGFPTFLFWVYHSCEHYQCHLSSLLFDFATQKLTIQELYDNVPSANFTAFLVWATFIGLQAILMIIMPGKKVLGQPTPAGNRLLYNINGLQAFFATVIVLGVLYYLDFFDAAIVHNQIGPLIVVTNVAAISTVILLYIKGQIAPTNTDTVQSGHHSMIYDICMGVELNPRIGNFDLKLFFIARCGMISWILVDLSHAAGQFERFGEVSNSMILVCFLHSIYVIDLLYYEAWYLETIDIMHDRLGFNLTYGVLVYVPFAYTFQAWYLAHNPIVLPDSQFYLILGVGIFAYYLFRSSNNQRRSFRAAKGNIKIWGKPAKYIRAKYTTVDGKEGESLLLTSGWWGLARHFNYSADLIQSFCYCVPCGFHDFMPWWYFIFMVWLLNHRGNRDNQRCGMKYGKYWEQYCKTVPYKLVPYVY